MDLNACNLCPWYESLDKFWSPETIPKDVYTIDDIKRFGATGCNPISDDQTSNPSRADSVTSSKPQKFCPYFAARRLIHSANIVILNYQYVLDPKVAQVALGGSGLFSIRGQISAGAFNTAAPRNLPTPAVQKEPNIIVFDEAHNIDNVCIEALSINITILDLERCRSNIKKLNEALAYTKTQDRDKLAQEYQRLIRRAYDSDPENARSLDYESFLEEHLASPILPQEQKLLEIAMPGNIRRAEVFIMNLSKIVHYLDHYIR